MQRHVVIVATAFQAMGLLIGIPSLIASAWLGWHAVMMHRLTPQNPTPAAPESTTSLITLLVDGARLLGKVFSAFAGATQVVMTIAAVAAFVALLFSVLLFFIGRGLHAHESWARVVGIILMFGMVFMSGIGALSVRRGLIGFALTAMAASSIYGLWTLFRDRRF